MKPTDQAFPVTEDPASIVWEGMDIRTWLTGQALAADGLVRRRFGDTDRCPPEDAAAWAVEAADHAIALLNEPSTEAVDPAEEHNKREAALTDALSEVSDADDLADAARRIYDLRRKGV
jgi:hypothetical protein